jgi:hypothetical protein
MALGESGRAAFCDLLAVDLTAWRHAGRAAIGEEDLECLTGAVVSVLEQWTRLKRLLQKSSSPHSEAGAGAAVSKDAQRFGLPQGEGLGC